MDTLFSLVRPGEFPGFIMGGLLLAAAIAWSLIWKGLALWRAVENRQKVWFWVLLVVNTLGVLEILYLFVFGKKRQV